MDMLKQYKCVEIICENEILFAVVNVLIILLIFIAINYCHLYRSKEDSVPADKIAKSLVLGSISLYFISKLREEKKNYVDTYESTFND